MLPTNINTHITRINHKVNSENFHPGSEHVIRDYCRQFCILLFSFFFRMHRKKNISKFSAVIASCGKYINVLSEYTLNSFFVNLKQINILCCIFILIKNHISFLWLTVFNFFFIIYVFSGHGNDYQQNKNESIMKAF